MRNHSEGRFRGDRTMGNGLKSKTFIFVLLIGGFMSAYSKGEQER